MQKTTIAFYTTGFFTFGKHDGISSISNMGYARKGKEMIRSQIAVLFKTEHMDLSLCSFNMKQHGPLACLYKTENRTVKRQPD